MFAAGGAGADQSGRAENPEMVAERALGHLSRLGSGLTGKLGRLAVQAPHDVQAAWIGEGMQRRLQRDVIQAGVRVRSHKPYLGPQQTI